MSIDTWVKDELCQ